MENDLTGDGKLLAPAGSFVTGRILNAEKSGRVKGRAKMAISLHRIEVGGQTYTLDTNKLSFEAEGTAGRDAKRVGIATGIGAAIGAIAGGGKGAAIGAAIGGGAGAGATVLTAGKEVEFPVEQLFEFRLEKDVEMKIVRR